SHARYGIQPLDPTLLAERRHQRELHVGDAQSSMSGSVFVGVRAVLFDLDGTLLDSAPDLGAAADALRVRHGLPSLPMSAYRAHAGEGARGMLRVAFDIGPEHDRFEEHKREFFDLYEQCLFERTRAFEGVDSVICALQTRRVPWGAVTNKSQRFT